MACSERYVPLMGFFFPMFVVWGWGRGEWSESVLCTRRSGELSCSVPVARGSSVTVHCLGWAFGRPSSGFARSSVRTATRRFVPVRAAGRQRCSSILVAKRHHGNLDRRARIACGSTVANAIQATIIRSRTKARYSLQRFSLRRVVNMMLRRRGPQPRRRRLRPRELQAGSREGHVKCHCDCTLA